MDFVAIDPSINETGLCWVVDGELVHVARVKGRSYGGLSERVYYMVTSINNAIKPGLVRIIERPHIRHDTPNPESIIKLTLVVGGITRDKTRYVLPRAWKGTTKKDVKTRRIEAQVRQEFPLLSDRLDAIPEGVRHNALDACGIALWELGIIWEKNK